MVVLVAFVTVIAFVIIFDMQGTASEATLVAILSARAKTIREKREVEERQEGEEDSIMTRLVCYGSAQAHSSVERAGLLAGVSMTNQSAE